MVHTTAHPNLPSTPSRAPRSSVRMTTDLPTPSTSPRCPPKCRTCHRLRQGHPRSGCPYAEPTVTVAQKISGGTEDGIVDDMSSLYIVNSNDEFPSLPNETPTQSKNRKHRLSVRFALLPAGSLASLSSTSSEIAEGLLQPGMMSSMADDEDDQRAILQWKRALTGPESPSEDSLDTLELDAK